MLEGSILHATPQMPHEPRFRIRPMTHADAYAIAGWRYPGIYSFYDADSDPNDLAELLDPEGWGTRYFAADVDGDLAGHLVFKLAEAGIAEIGLGLRPDLTGRGLGLPFLRAAMRYGEQELGATSFTLAVAAFNHRAIKVYERAGFTATDRCLRATNGALHDFIRMTAGPPEGQSPAG